MLIFERRLANSWVCRRSWVRHNISTTCISSLEDVECILRIYFESANCPFLSDRTNNG